MWCCSLSLSKSDIYYFIKTNNEHRGYKAHDYSKYKLYIFKLFELCYYRVFRLFIIINSNYNAFLSCITSSKDHSEDLLKINMLLFPTQGSSKKLIILTLKMKPFIILIVPNILLTINFTLHLISKRKDTNMTKIFQSKYLVVIK